MNAWFGWLFGGGKSQAGKKRPAVRRARPTLEVLETRDLAASMLGGSLTSAQLFYPPNPVGHPAVASVQVFFPPTPVGDHAVASAQLFFPPVPTGHPAVVSAELFFPPVPIG